MLQGYWTEIWVKLVKCENYIWKFDWFWSNLLLFIARMQPRSSNLTKIVEKWEWYVKFWPILVKFANICCKHAATILKSDQNRSKVLMACEISTEFGQICWKHVADILEPHWNRVNCANRSSNLTEIGQRFCFNALFCCGQPIRQRKSHPQSKGIKFCFFLKVTSSSSNFKVKLMLTSNHTMQQCIISSISYA